MNDEIRIQMTGPCRGKVWVNGEEMTGVIAIEFSAGLDRINTVRLSLIAKTVIITGPAEVVRDVTDLSSESRTFERVSNQ